MYMYFHYHNTHCGLIIIANWVTQITFTCTKDNILGTLWNILKHKVGTYRLNVCSYIVYQSLLFALLWHSVWYVSCWTAQKKKEK